MESKDYSCGKVSGIYMKTLLLKDVEERKSRERPKKRWIYWGKEEMDIKRICVLKELIAHLHLIEVCGRKRHVLLTPHKKWEMSEKKKRKNTTTVLHS